MDFRIRLQPKQDELLRLVESSPATWLGYGGSRGGGKSAAARRIQLVRRWKYQGTRGLLFRRTFDNLWENHIEPLFREWPELRALYSSTHHELTLPNGSAIKFGYAEHESDIYDFQGKEYMDICVDEATHLAEKELKFLKTCNRWPGISAQMCKMILTMNPGNVGHAFVKRVFHDKEYHENEKPEDYAFIQAYGWDNVEWVRVALEKESLTDADFYGWDDKTRFEWFIERSDYGRTLNNLPHAMRIGHLLGRWDVFAGQYFDIFDRAKHVFRPEQMDLKDWHRRWIGIDWGYQHPACAHWNSRDGKTIKTYRELHAQHNDPRQLAERICSLSRLTNGTPEKIGAIFLSPDAWQKRTSENTIAEQMNEVFRAHGLPSASPADDDRVGGWMAMYNALKYGEWIIADNCAELLKALPSLTRDDKKVEDCVKFDGDDAADSARYSIKSELATGAAPFAERVAQRVEAMQKKIQGDGGPPPDYNAIAMQSRKAEAEERKKMRPARIVRRRNLHHHRFSPA